MAECHSPREHAAAVTHRPVKIDLVNRRHETVINLVFVNVQLAARNVNRSIGPHVSLTDVISRYSG